jgi:Mg2+ and Co2+ transporter CorA
MQCKTEISTLDDIVEDQYNMLAFVPKINWTEESKLLRSDLKEQIHGLGYLKNSYERLIEKIDNIHSHYQLILQERGNKRLNTLTVVQAIFVPNTFLAGIYGMNFSFMPELEWKYSYFIILGVIVGISIFQLWWFKRKGWFN